MINSALERRILPLLRLTSSFNGDSHEIELINNENSFTKIVGIENSAKKKELFQLLYVISIVIWITQQWKYITYQIIQ